MRRKFPRNPIQGPTAAIEWLTWSRNALFLRWSPALFVAGTVLMAAAPTAGAAEQVGHVQRVNLVRGIPGLVAFWDFVAREDGPRGTGRFISTAGNPDDARFILEPHNISRDFWREGAEATLADFPLLGRGPFGQAVQFRNPRSKTDLPVLEVPRSKLQDTGLDAKGPGRSVTLVVWLVHQGGDHAIAGLWHEGTDTPGVKERAAEVVRGQRQYGLFAGLSAKPGSVAAHVSENGLASFGLKYANHMSITNTVMTTVPPTAAPAEIDFGWSMVGLVYDNSSKDVTSYLNGVAEELWIQPPSANHFYRNTAMAWRQTQLARNPDLPRLESDSRPPLTVDQFYEPPETSPLSESVISETPDSRTVLRFYKYTKVSTTYRKDDRSGNGVITNVELVALKANPYWLGHDLYAPANSNEGAPFTIGRVIHSNRHATLSAHIGGVAVYDRPLTPTEMAALAEIGRSPAMPPIALVDAIAK